MEVREKDKIIELLGDNFGAVSLSSNSRKKHNLVKYIDVKHHYVREKVESKEVRVQQIGSKDNVADGMTKALGPVAQEKFVQSLKLLCTEQGRC